MNFYEQDNNIYVDSIDMMKSELIESEKKNKNSNTLNYYLNKSIEIFNEFNANVKTNRVLTNKNQENSIILNNTIHLKIAKNHLPISPKSYLKKWESEVKKKTNQKRRTSE